MGGKRFAADFDRIDAVKSDDRILVQDSGDGYVKYANPSQLMGSAVVVEELSGAVVELIVAGNHEYVCGELSSLTVTSVENSAAVSVVRFRSGATPTELTLPATLPVTGWRIPQPDTTYDLYFRGGAATIVGYE